MKVFYLAQVNFGCVVYADNKNDAFEKMKCQRKELLETLGLPLDITRYNSGLKLLKENSYLFVCGNPDVEYYCMCNGYD